MPTSISFGARPFCDFSAKPRANPVNLLVRLIHKTNEFNSSVFPSA